MGRAGRERARVLPATLLIAVIIQPTLPQEKTQRRQHPPPTAFESSEGSASEQLSVPSATGEKLIGNR
jgi:hypothetical protein